MTRYTNIMKTAISLPTDLFHEIDAKARALRLSRSGLLTAAAREYLARRRSTEDATVLWNEAIDKGGQPGSDPAAAALRRRSKAVVRSTQGKRR